MDTNETREYILVLGESAYYGTLRKTLAWAKDLGAILYQELPEDYAELLALAEAIFSRHPSTKLFRELATQACDDASAKGCLSFLLENPVLHQEFSQLQEKNLEEFYERIKTKMVQEDTPTDALSN